MQDNHCSETEILNNCSKSHLFHEVLRRKINYYTLLINNEF